MNNFFIPHLENIHTPTIHSNLYLTLPLRRSTKISIDLQKKFLIKGIYKNPVSFSKINKNYTVFQGSLSSTKEKTSQLKITLKTEESSLENKYPFCLNKNAIVSKTPMIREFEEVQTLALNPTKKRFMSYDMKKAYFLSESNKKSRKSYLNQANNLKANRVSYQKSSNLNQKGQSPNISIISRISCSKRKKSMRKSLIKEPPKPSSMKEIKKMSLFENKFVENLNEIISNPIEPPTPMDLFIKQSDMKYEGYYLTI